MQNTTNISCTQTINLWDVIVPWRSKNQQRNICSSCLLRLPTTGCLKGIRKIKSICFYSNTNEYLPPSFTMLQMLNHSGKAIKSSVCSTNEVSTASGDFGVSSAGGISQIDEDDLEELDLRWQVAILRLVKSGRNQGKRSYGDNGRSNAPTNESSSQALVAQDGLGGYDWSNDFEVEPVNYALMAISSSSSSSSSDNENLDELLNSQMSARDKTGLGCGTQLNEMSNNSKTNSEISLSVFDVRSRDEENTLANDSFSKVDGFHVVSPPITWNFLTPRADISFAGLDEYAIRKKIIESKTTDLNAKTSETVGKTNEANTQKPKTFYESVNRDKVIIEDWNSDDEDDVSEVQTVSPVKTNETQTVKTRVDKIGPRVDKPVWDNTKRVNHQKNSKYPHLRKTFVPSVILTRIGLITPVKQNEKRAVHKVSTAKPVSTARPVSIARPVSTARPFAPKIAQTSGAIRQFTQEWTMVQNMTTVGIRAVVNTSKGKMHTDLIKSRWVWRPKGNYLDHVSKDSRSFMLKKDHAVVDSGCSSHMTGNKAYLSNYEDYNEGFVAFGSDPKGDELKFNLFSISQMCDKKNSVLFSETVCLILSPSFKLFYESQVILRAPRKDDVYSLNLKNIVLSGDITCLYANATADESKLWHMRLDDEGNNDNEGITGYGYCLLVVSSSRSSAVLGQMTYLVASSTLDSARTYMMQGAPFTQGTISSIPIGGSISPEGFLLPVLLLVVIIVTVVIVIVILKVIVDDGLQVKQKKDGIVPLDRTSSTQIGPLYPKGSPPTLEAFSDSDYAGASFGQKSTTSKANGLGKDFPNPFMAGSLPKTIKQSNDPPLSRGYTLGSGEDSLELKELMANCTQIVCFVRKKNREICLELILLGTTLSTVSETAILSTTEEGLQAISATIDGHEKLITEDSLRRHLKLDDAEGISSLSNEEIFEHLAHMGSKKTAWDQFSSNIATALICLATSRRTYLTPTLTSKLFSNMRRASKGYSGVVTPLFESMLVQAHDEEQQQSPSRIKSTPSLSPQPTPLSPSPKPIQPTHEAEETASMPYDSPLHDVHSHGSAEGSQTKKTYSTALTKLVLRVKKLEYKLKSGKARRKAKIVLSDDDEIAEDSSKQERKIS
ncbi:hypothetical protein Tco_0031157 [Tanacetum coccineum]